MENLCQKKTAGFCSFHIKGPIAVMRFCHTCSYNFTLHVLLGIRINAKDAKTPVSIDRLEVLLFRRQCDHHIYKIPAFSGNDLFKRCRLRLDPFSICWAIKRQIFYSLLLVLVANLRPFYGILKNIDCLIIDLCRDGKWMTILTAVGKRESRRIGKS